MVLGQSLGLVAIGLGLGLVATLVAGRLLESLLFGLEPTDPATVAQAVALLLAVAAVASHLPARRAARVQPVVALRSE
jgi:putative ABC transport system permease protein